jgi:hypothetical protein
MSGLRQPITTSFIAIDPYPHHVVAAVRLISKGIIRRYQQGNIKHETYLHLSAVLLKSLEHLPQTSKMVSTARESLEASLHSVEASYGDESNSNSSRNSSNTEGNAPQP